MTAEARVAPRTVGFRIVPAVAVMIGVAILLALGVWQVERLEWKTRLLAQIAALQTAPPEPLNVVLNRLQGAAPGWDGTNGIGKVDFVRVQTTCPTLQQTPTLRLYALAGGAIGRRLITACPITAGPYRSLLVDRGFVPDPDSTSPAFPPPGPAPKGPAPATDGPVIGVLRRAEPPSWLSLPNKPAENDWRSRDLPAMARALGAADPAPVFLMLESPAPADGQPPRPAAIPTDIPNNHLGYALTWFGLAAGLVGVYVASLRCGARR